MKNLIQTRVGRLRIDDRKRLVWPLDLWPEADRRLWDEGVRPIDQLDLEAHTRHADSLRPQTIANARKSYGRFLRVLHENGQLVEQGLAARVTPDMVALFFSGLRDHGNAHNSIKVRLMDLRVALRIMVPALDFSWITRPNDRSLDSLLQQVIRDDIKLPDPAALMTWARTMMDEAMAADLRMPGAWRRACRRYRNGLIIALLTARAPRLASLAAMLNEKNLRQRDDEWWVLLQARIVKTKRLLEYSLPPELTSYVTYYLDYVRPALVDPIFTEALWGNGNGGVFTARSIQTMINRETRKRFGCGFGPHLFRKVLATGMAKQNPRSQGVAAAVLGISVDVADTYYRKQRQETAALRFQRNLRDERRATRKISSREMDV